MTRFLSPEWFEQVARHSAEPGPPAGDRLVLRQVVQGTPDGDVHYHVIVESGTARIVAPDGDPGPADLTITTAWETAAEIAQGKLGAQEALAEGKLRISGNLACVATHAGTLAGLDPLPATVREQTTY